jgi:hypothetical protein
MKAWIFLLLLPSLPLGAQPNEELSVGESRGYDLPPYDYVEVSRKGLIEVVYEETKRRWKITGLRAGFVVVSFFEQKEAPAPSEKLYVEVIQPKDPKREEVCDLPGVRCRDKKSLISGEISNFMDFFYAKHLCRKTTGCFFALTLTQEGRQNAALYAENEIQNKHLLYTVSPSGLLQMSGNCPEKPISFGFFSEPTQSIPCKGQDAPKEMFQIYGKVLLMSSLTAKELGLDTVLDAKGSLKQGVSWDLGSALKASMQKDQIRVLAEPNIRVFMGEKATLHSGNEFAVREEKEEKSYTNWKETGVKLEAQINPGDGLADRVFLDYDFFLKTKEKESAALGAHQLKSRILMTLGKSQVVGGAEFEKDEEGSQGLPFQGIPIIGPLVMGSKKRRAQFQVHLWLEVKKVPLTENN